MIECDSDSSNQCDRCVDVASGATARYDYYSALSVAKHHNKMTHNKHPIKPQGSKGIY